MKRAICIVFAAVIAFVCCACAAADNGRKPNGVKTVNDILSEAENGGYQKSVSPAGKFKGDGEKEISAKKCDIDLTGMESNMVTAMVNDFYANPDNYVGKIIKAHGTFDVTETAARNYYLCVMTDPTGCCSPFVEFSLKNERKYPDELPEKNAEITVIGEFETYLEDGKKYCQLKDTLIN